MKSSSEDLRQTMRCWATGVCVVCSQFGETQHGMTVNSFTSISLEPPIISVTLARGTRTLYLVQESGQFSISILQSAQRDIAERFAGLDSELANRFQGMAIKTLHNGLIAIPNALGYLECQVRMQIPLDNSILILSDVLFSYPSHDCNPLIYHNRGFHNL